MLKMSRDAPDCACSCSRPSHNSCVAKEFLPESWQLQPESDLLLARPLLLSGSCLRLRRRGGRSRACGNCVPAVVQAVRGFSQKRSQTRSTTRHTSTLPHHITEACFCPSVVEWNEE